MDFPRTVEEITSEWLTQVLRESGAIRESSVVSFTTAAGLSGGLVGNVNRMLLEYNQKEDGAPDSVVAKVANTDEEFRTRVNHSGYTGREIEFYRQYAPIAGMGSPSIYAIEYDRESGYFIILLEDLGHLREVHQSADCSFADGSSAVQSLARMHAKWWDHEQLFRATWFMDVSNIENLIPMTDNYAQGIDPLLEIAGDYLPAGYESLARKYGESMVKVIQTDGKGPVTLIHGDFRLGNLFFDDAKESENPVVAFDWETMGRMKGSRDLAYFLSLSFATESRRKYEKRLLADYHDSIVELGVKNYSFDEFSTDVRVSALWSIRQVTLATVTLGGGALETEGSKKMFKALWERMQTVIDWNCDEVIPK
jgi:thiamine kinase-like enzyme